MISANRITIELVLSRIEFLLAHWRSVGFEAPLGVVRWPIAVDDIPLRLLSMGGSEFELPATLGGRGDTYRAAQADHRVRAAGIRTILNRLGARAGSQRSPRVILDALGGNGLVSGFCRACAPASSPLRNVTVISSDLAWSMVTACVAAGHLAMWQPAQALFMTKDHSVDAAFLAYGTHHIPAGERHLAARELLRVVRPGGRVLIHDFEVGSRAARWFAEVVDPCSTMGHPHTHFYIDELRALLSDAGAADVCVEVVDDPMVVRGATRELAEQNFVRMLIGMYGLVRLDCVLGADWTSADLLRLCDR